MSKRSLQRNVNLFTQAALKRSKTAMNIIDYHTREDYLLLNTPYANGKYHAHALLYPLCHITKLIVDICRLLPGLVLLIQTALYQDKKSNETILKGLALQCITIGLDLANIALSLVALVSRTIAVLVYGYPHDFVTKAVQDQYGDNLFSKAVGYIGGAVAETAMSCVDAEISTQTFSL